MANEVRILTDTEGADACPDGYFALYEHANHNANRPGKVLLVPEGVDIPNLADHGFEDVSGCSPLNKTSRTATLEVPRSHPKINIGAAAVVGSTIALLWGVSETRRHADIAQGDSIGAGITRGGQIFTTADPLVVSINPYKDLGFQGL